MKYKVICLVDTTRIAPCPMEPRIPHDLAEHLQLVVGGRLFELVDHDAYDLLEQRLVVFPLVRKRGVTIVLCDFVIDAGMIDVCGRGGDQLLKYRL